MQENKLHATQLLLTNPELRLDLVNMSGSSALHLACRKNSSSVIAPFCQDRRCTEEIINQKNKYGQTAVMLAVQFGALKCLKELDSIKYVDWETKKNGKSLMDEAYHFGQRETLDFLNGRSLRLKLENGIGTDPDQVGEVAAKIARLNISTAKLEKEAECLKLIHRAERMEMEENLSKLIESQKKEEDIQKTELLENYVQLDELKQKLQSSLGLSPTSSLPTSNLWRPYVIQPSKTSETFDCKPDLEK